MDTQSIKLGYILMILIITILCIVYNVAGGCNCCNCLRLLLKLSCFCFGRVAFFWSGLLAAAHLALLWGVGSGAHRVLRLWQLSRVSFLCSRRLSGLINTTHKNEHGAAPHSTHTHACTACEGRAGPCPAKSGVLLR